MKNFPKFEETLATLKKQFPHSPEEDLYASAVGTLAVNWSGDITSRSLYILKLYKARPEVKEALDTSIMFDEESIRNDIRCATRARNFRATCAMYDKAMDDLVDEYTNNHLPY